MLHIQQRFPSWNHFVEWLVIWESQHIDKEISKFEQYLYEKSIGEVPVSVMVVPARKQMTYVNQNSRYSILSASNTDVTGATRVL